MADVTYKQANQRYRRLFIPVMICYVALCILGPAMLIWLGHPPKWVWGAVAIVTGAPIIIVFWLMGRLLRETDEYTRKVHVDAALTGGAITLSVSIVWSFLELYQVAPRLEHFPSMMMMAPLFFVSYGLSMFVQRLQRH